MQYWHIMYKRSPTFLDKMFYWYLSGLGLKHYRSLQTNELEEVCDYSNEVIFSKMKTKLLFKGKEDRNHNSFLLFP